MGELAEDFRWMKEVKRRERMPIEARRLEGCKKDLEEKGFNVSVVSESELYVSGHGINFKFYPYKGWWTGKGIGSDRGYKKLIKKLRRIGAIR